MRIARGISPIPAAQQGRRGFRRSGMGEETGGGVTVKIDALCLCENGEGFFCRDVILLFSLAPGSPSLGGKVPSAAWLMRPGPRPGISPKALGLLDADNLDAANCHGNLFMIDLYLPLVQQK